MSTKDFAQRENLPEFLSEGDAKKLLVQLLTIVWEKLTDNRRLSTYQMANQRKAFYGTEKLFGRKRLTFDGIKRGTKKALIGYKTIKDIHGVRKKRFWHFAISARPILWPCYAYAIRSHVLFSDDGDNIFTNAHKMHRARRTQCKDWWNDDWRDRMLLIMSWLKGENEKIIIAVSSDVSLEIADSPNTFISPVSYKDPEGRHIMASITGFEEDTDKDTIDGEDKE